MTTTPSAQTERMFITPNIILAATALVILLRWQHVYLSAWSDYWFLDYRYFWTAAQLWTTGVSPYTDEYLAFGAAHFASFEAPFFYPPNIAVFLTPLSWFDATDGAKALFAANIAFLAGIASALTAVIKTISPRTNSRLIFCILLFAVGIGARSAFNIVIYGQITIILCFALSLFLWAFLKGRRGVLSATMIFLLIKPQIGIPIAAYCFARRDTRTAAIAALAATGLLAALGLGVENPVGNFKNFLSNLETYSQFAANHPTRTGGLQSILNAASVSVSSLALIILLAAPAAILGYAQSRKAASLAAPCAVIVWAVFAAPMHMTDFILLAPLMVCLFSPFSYRTIIGAALLFLARSWEISAAFSLGLVDSRSLATAGQTVALTAIFYCLARILIEESRMLAVDVANAPRQGHRPLPDSL